MNTDNKAPDGDQPSAKPPEPNTGGRTSAGGQPGDEQATATQAGSGRGRRGSRGGRRRRKPAEPQAAAAAAAEPAKVGPAPSRSAGVTAPLEGLPTAPLIPIASQASPRPTGAPPRGRTRSRSRRPVAAEPAAAGPDGTIPRTGAHRDRALEAAA